MRFVSTAMIMMAMALMLLALMLLAPPARANPTTFVASPQVYFRVRAAVPGPISWSGTARPAIDERWASRLVATPPPTQSYGTLRLARVIFLTTT